MYLKVRNIIFVIIFGCLFMLPILQRQFTLALELPLGGSTFQAEIDEFSMEGLLSGKFFQSVGNWYGENFGFHKTLVRFENQMNYSVFGDFSRMYDGAIVVGNEQWLFQKWLLLCGFEDRKIDEARMISQIRRLKKLQDLMDQTGVPIILVIAPLKSSVFPEMIPRKYLRYDRPENRNYYERIKPILDAYGVRYFDSIQTARELRNKNLDFQLFAPDGTHWTFAYAAYCTEQIAQMINPSMKVPFPEFEVNYDRKDQAIWTEKDLRVVSNLTYSKNRETILSYPTISILNKDQPRPKIAIIGDSYAESIINMFSGVFGGELLANPTDFYYYFKAYQKFPGPEKVPLDRVSFDLRRDILADKDALLIVLSESVLYDIGFGFLERVIQNGE